MPRSRSLKVEATGDFFSGDTKPKIRLQGRWLATLGFIPGGRVLVSPALNGSLTLTFQPPAQPSPRL